MPEPIAPRGIVTDAEVGFLKTTSAPISSLEVQDCGFGISNLKTKLLSDFPCGSAVAVIESVIPASKNPSKTMCFFLFIVVVSFRGLSSDHTHVVSDLSDSEFAALPFSHSCSSG